MLHSVVVQFSPREAGLALVGETLTASAYEPGYERLWRTTKEPTSLSSSSATATDIHRLID